MEQDQESRGEMLGEGAHEDRRHSERDLPVWPSLAKYLLSGRNPESHQGHVHKHPGCSEPSPVMFLSSTMFLQNHELRRTDSETIQSHLNWSMKASESPFGLVFVRGSENKLSITTILPRGGIPSNV